MAENVGELNFILTKEINDYIKVKGLRYSTINDILGAFVGVQAGHLVNELSKRFNSLLVEYKARHSRNLVGKEAEVYGDMWGSIEGAKLEFYRRVAVPYENEKMSVHGDVYTYAESKITAGGDLAGNKPVTDSDWAGQSQGD